MVAFTQAFFSRQWLGNAIRRVTQLLTVATVIAIAYGALIDFSTTVLAWSLGTYVALTLCMVGLVDASLRGARAARAIALGCALMFGMESLKLMTIIGQQQFTSTLSLMGPWTVVLTASFIIVMVNVGRCAQASALCATK